MPKKSNKLFTACIVLLIIGLIAFFTGLFLNFILMIAPIGLIIAVIGAFIAAIAFLYLTIDSSSGL